MPSEPEHEIAAEFAQLLRAGQSRLYGYIHSLLRDLNDTDDLFQQTTLVLWRKFDQFDRSGDFLAWACGVARFEVANFLRARGRQRLYFTDDLNLLLAEAQVELTNAELDDRRHALTACLAQLRERDRDLLTECYDEADGVNGAAQRRGRAPQSIHNSLRRIRRSLYECIERTLSRQSQPEWAP